MVAGKEVTPRSLARLAASKAKVAEYRGGVITKVYTPGRSLVLHLAEAIQPHFEMPRITVHHPDEPRILRLTPRHVARLLESPRKLVPEIHMDSVSESTLQVVKDSKERRKIVGLVRHKGKEWTPRLILRVQPEFKDGILISLATSPRKPKGAIDQLWEDERRGEVPHRHYRPVSGLRLVHSR